MRDYIDIQGFIDEQDIKDYNIDMDNNSNRFWNEVDNSRKEVDIYRQID